MNNKRKPTIKEFARYAQVTNFTGDYKDEVTGIVLYYVNGSVKSAKIPELIFDKIDSLKVFRID